MVLRLNWRVCVYMSILLALALSILPLVLNGGERVQPLDPLPRRVGDGHLGRNGPDVVLQLVGTPEQMGKQHGTLLKTTIRAMVRDYVRPNIEGERGRRLLAAARIVRDVLPQEYLTELDACADAAGVNPDELLIAQCHGDLQTAIIGVPGLLSHSCSSYVAFGPATADGSLQCGRNLDYFFGERVADYASLVTYYTPEAGHGYRFAAVGLAGILGGWTLVNERGLIIANHLGGGSTSRLDGLPTLILTRQIAQHAATVDEAVRMLEEFPRMRGQIVWLAQEANPSQGRTARAVAVEYDAERTAVRESEGGIMIVTNENRAFNKTPKSHPTGYRYTALEKLIEMKRGTLNPSDMLTLSPTVADVSTLHSVQFHPTEGSFQVYFRIGWKMQRQSVRYAMP